jgi:transcriptional regulator with XRE-family HTH domain
VATHLRVKELTDEKGWAIAKLARRARLDYSVVHRYYNDKPSQYDKGVLDKLAWALGVGVSDLFGGEPQPIWDDRLSRALVPS